MSASAPNVLATGVVVNEEDYERAKARVGAIYELHAPDKVGKVSALLNKYKGNERWLITQVEQKYNVKPTDIIGGTGGEEKLASEDLEVQSVESGEGESVVVGDGAEEEEEEEEDEDEEEGGGESGEDEEEEADSDYEEGEEEEDDDEEEEDEEEEDEEGGGGEDELEGEEEEEEVDEQEPESEVPVETDPWVEDEDENLFDFDRIYPVPASRQHIKHPNYAALKAFVFEQDVKRQMRLKAPLQQRKTQTAADYEMYVGASERASEARECAL
jgi:hypothetical protein